MRDDLPSGTVTFLFTDVEGSTKLLHELGAEAYDEALIEHRRVLREAFGRHGGVEVDTQGDAFFYAFPSATGALQAASEGQSAFAAGPIIVRMGLHTGMPHIGKEGYIGDDVHLGARVASSGHGGQVILSAATAELVELELRDLGEHRLKDIAEAVPIFQFGDGSFPPLKTISNTNLPRPASSFVGRESETEDVVALLRDGARLVNLTGPGGTGKTRLSIEAASELVPDFKAGVFWVGLATLRDPALVTETIAQTLGAKDGLADHIGEREMLLLLDNIEQVIEAAPELADLLEACPNLRLLVTSRELLRVRGEVEYAVPPLADAEAVSLFCTRSGLDPNVTIAELCRRLDSLPLAVELAAARTSVLTPSQILERLSQRLDLLKGGRDADPRQETLRATIEWSYELLSPEEQQLFARLSVFAGGCTLEAAEEVVDADLDTLQSLVEKSLLRFTDERYWMLETIREYGLERLSATGATQATRQQIAQWYLKLLKAAESDLSKPEWLQRLARESPNLRGALDTLEDSSPVAYTELTGLLWGFWTARQHVTEGRSRVESALALCAGASSPQLRERLLAGASWLALFQGDLDAAATRGEERLDNARRADDWSAVAKSLSMLGSLAAERNEFESAVRYSEEAIATVRAHSESSASEAGLVHNLGVVWERAGDSDCATAAYSEARSLYEQAGDVGGVASETIALGSAAVLGGDYLKAQRLLSDGFREAAVAGVAGFWVDVVLVLLAEIDAERGEFVRAARHVGFVEQLMEDSGTTLAGQHRRRFEATRARILAELAAEESRSSLAEGRLRASGDHVRYVLESLD